MKKIIVMMVGLVFGFGSAQAGEENKGSDVVQPTIRLEGEIPLASDTLSVQSVSCSTGGVWTVTSNLSLRRETLQINGSTMDVRVMQALITTEIETDVMEAALGNDYSWAKSAAQTGSFAPSGELKAALLAAVGAKLVGAE